MNHKKLKASIRQICICIFLSVLMLSHTSKQQVPSVKEKFYLYLLIGQSNMAGRAVVEPQDTIGDPRILCLNKNGQWVVAREPLHFDKPKAAGVGPGLSFARAMLSSLPSDAKIGLIPAACGGSPIRVWAPGQFWDQTKSYPYDDAVRRTTIALQTGTLKGILWHQGTADKSAPSVAVYKSRLISLVAALRKKFQAPDVPFIAGELGPLAGKEHPIDRILHEAKADISFYDIVSATGLAYNADSVHFDSPSQRILGRRYAEKSKQFFRK